MTLPNATSAALRGTFFLIYYIYFFYTFLISYFSAFYLYLQKNVGGSWMPARQVTSPHPATRWSTRPILTATGSSRRRSRRSASCSTSTRTLRSRGWTASKAGSKVAGVNVHDWTDWSLENLKKEVFLHLVLSYSYFMLCFKLG